MQTSRILNLVALASLPLAACSTSSGAMERSRFHASRGDYYLAYQALEEARAKDSNNEELERAFWQARLDFLVDQGRQFIFLDQERQAVLYLNQALAIEPGMSAALELIDRARQKMADRATERGDALLMQGELEHALIEYTEALQEVPGHPGATAGTEGVRKQFDMLHAKAQRHFLQALKKQPQLRHIEVDWHAATALQNNPSREDARELGEQSQREIARQRFERATEATESGHFGSALLDFRAVKALVSDYPGIDERIAHMEKEVAAQDKLEAAVMKIKTEEFALARDLLDEAFDLTILQRAEISELKLQARRRESEADYDAAKVLELQHKKQEALEAFLAIDAEYKNGFLDVKTRISSLELDIDSAQKAWAAAEEAEKAGNVEDAVQAYEEVQLFYPGYRDVAQRLARLKG